MFKGKARLKCKVSRTVTRNGRAYHFYDKGYPLHMRIWSEIRLAIFNYQTRRLIHG